MDFVEQAGLRVAQPLNDFVAVTAKHELRLSVLGVC